MKTLARILIVGLVLILIGEMVARWGLGLGNPPLSVGDAEIDYLFAPHQRCNRFGNKLVYNNLSMRCDFDVDETVLTNRIYVVGDSVVNGGALTDHEALATTLLQRTLPDVQVCNISAGSWGPGNCAAYFRRHPNLRGGCLIVEVNSHDLWEDDPQASGGALVGKDVALVDRKPWSALGEGFSRYFLPRVRRWMGKARVNTKVDLAKWGKDAYDSSAERNLKALDWLFAQPFDWKCLLIHRSRQESTPGAEISAGEARFRKWAKDRGVECSLLKLSPETDYRDKIHLNDAGQRKLFQSLMELVRRDN